MEFADLFARAQQFDEYWIDALVTEFTEEVVRLMESKGISRGELAESLGTRPSYVTKILKGNVNFTFATVAKICGIIGVRPRLHLAPKGSRTFWFDSMEGDRLSGTGGSNRSQQRVLEAGRQSASVASAARVPTSGLLSPQFAPLSNDVLVRAGGIGQ